MDRRSVIVVILTNGLEVIIVVIIKTLLLCEPFFYMVGFLIINLAIKFVFDYEDQLTTNVMRVEILRN